MTNTQWLRQRLLANVFDPAIGDKTENLERLRKSEWSAEFERLMRNRLIMWRFRYGRIDRTHNTDYDRIGSTIERLRAYMESGNMEYLVDAANLCLLEFEHGVHPARHFKAVDDGRHVEKMHD